MIWKLFIAALLVTLSSGACLWAEEDDDESTGARDTMRLDMSQRPPLFPFFPERLDRRRTTERERNEATEPLGEMRNWDEHPTPSWFDNRTLDLPFKEDHNDLPVITPKIHINW